MTWRVLRRILRRERSPRRGAQRLLFDLAAVDRLVEPGRSARARLEAELGLALLRDLERRLDVPGLSRQRNRRHLRAA